MPTNIGQFLSRRAFLSPDLEALVEPSTGRRRTYAALNADTNRTANALVARGVRPGDRVAVLLMNGGEFVETFFAIAKIGAVAVPLNWRLVADELEFILHDSGATALVYGSPFAGMADELNGRGDRTPVTTWIQAGGPARPYALAYDDLQAAAPADEPEVGGVDHDLAFIMYTSGTTGLPKGVMHTHHTLLWAVLTINATADFRFQDRYLVSLPMFHVGALTPVIVCVYRGVSMVALETFEPRRSWELIRDERISTTLMVPAMLQFMLAAYDAGVHDASSLRWCLSGAAPVPVTLIEAYAGLGVEIHQIYGLTESGGPACLILGEDALARAGSTGRAFFHTEVRIVGPGGSECDPDQPGELVVRGEHVMVGYWNRPDATAETLRDGWLHTGDVATMDADGFVTICDRLKDMLISGGENIYPAEIENVLLAHERVADAAVIGIPSPRWGESPMAVVVRADAALTEDDLMAWCRGRLAPYKAVKAVVFTDEIPRNPSGKILKRLLREQFPLTAPE